MKLKTIIISMILIVSSTFAHKVLLMVEDNDDGTIYIEGGLSTGGSVAGSKIYITDKATGRPLWKGILGEDGSINAPQPKKPYLVNLSLGTGHNVSESGPLHTNKNDSINNAENIDSTIINNSDSIKVGKDK